jgi:hypothetical protein
MRVTIAFVLATMLSACGGGGPTTISGSAAPSTPVAAGAQNPHSFVNPADVKTYSAIGGVQHYEYYTDNRNIRNQYGQLYAGDSTTARNSGISVEYNPRDAVFRLVLMQPGANVNQTLRFQDPIHRTDFGGAERPQGGVPDIPGKGIQYLQAGSSTGAANFDPAQSDIVPVGPVDLTRNLYTFFYQKPGTTTNFVTYAGYLRNGVIITKEFEPLQAGQTVANSYTRQEAQLDRGAFVFGERTGNDAVPKTGTGTFKGDMLATMVFNNLRDDTPNAPTYYQWLAGTSTTTVDFAANTFSLALNGTVYAPQLDVFTTRDFSIQQGANFTAAGAGRVDLVSAGGFLGQINSAFFVNPNAQRFDVQIGGSSIDGAFFGPVGQEVGGGFRIVGGVPDERIDIVGAFTGK